MRKRIAPVLEDLAEECIDRVYSEQLARDADQELSALLALVRAVKWASVRHMSTLAMDRALARLDRATQEEP